VNADISSVLSGMLSNPEMLSRAMEMAKGLADSGVLSSLSASFGDKSDGDERDGSAAPAKARADGRAENSSDRIALLRAIKPFVNEDKCEKIELVIKLIGAFEMLRGIGKGSK